MPLLATKLYTPPLRPRHIPRARLMARLNANQHRPLVLVSAPAGFGKTTLISEWLAGQSRPAAWLSLDEADNDPARFLSYFVAALQTVQPEIGQDVVRILQAPQTPPLEALLTPLLNDLADIAQPFTLILDDYHLITAPAIDQALNFVVEHLPPPMQLVIATREDPPLPLHRLRARDQLAELRAADLRFTPAEAADFLNQTMGLNLSAAAVAALEARTEGWVVGLQLAAISMQGASDPARFIQSFAGSHRFILDYLLEEVLHKQSASVQEFLLQTAILDRLCGPLCEAVLSAPVGTGQTTLAYLEQANLFIVPLDNERQWYRYHHLFAELLRQRLTQSAANVTALHLRASQWLEDNDLDIEAFQHAAAANDIERAERLIAGKGIPLHLRGAVVMILDWFASLPEEVFNACPRLWWRYAALLLVSGHTTGVEEKLDAAEAALRGVEPDDETRHLVGRIAAARAVLALTRYQPDVMIAQSRRALEHLPLTNISTRANANWTLGYAYIYQGQRAAAREALTESITLSQSVGDIFTLILATIGLGNLQEGDNQLHLAEQTYQRILQLAGDQPLQIIYEAHLGLARILYEWNDLVGAQQAAEQSLHLAQQYDKVIDRFIVCEVFLARVQLARGDVSGAAAALAQAEQAARQRNFLHRLPDVAGAQVTTFLRLGQVAEAAHLAQAYNLPLGQARVQLARGNRPAALAMLDTLRQQMEARQWEDERLKAMVLQAVTHHLQGEKTTAVQLIAEALALAEPGGFIRLFVDEGSPMFVLLSEAAAQGIRPNYLGKVLAAFGATAPPPPTQPLAEPLTPRELEVLRLIAQGLSNDEIGQRLFLALDTVKGHNRKIFEKLHVQRRTEAVAQARKLGLL